MDSTGGDLNPATKGLESNVEKSHTLDSSEEEKSQSQFDDAAMAKLHSHTSDSSSDNLKPLDKLDSHIINVNDLQEGKDAFSHLPPNEREIITRQLDVPNVKISYKTLYRYATKNDIIIVVISCICAIAGGAVLPLMTVSVCMLSDK